MAGSENFHVQGEDSYLRHCALERLYRGATRPPAGSATALLLGDENARIRRYTLNSIKGDKACGSSKKVDSEVLELLTDRHPSVRHAAAEVLKSTGLEGSAPPAASLVIAQPGVRRVLLEDGVPAVQEVTASVLGGLHTGAENADELAALLKDPDGRVRQAAAKALGHMDSTDSKAAEVAACLRDDEVYNVAAKTLTGCGNNGLHEALKLFSDPDPNVRRRAVGVAGAMVDGKLYESHQQATLLKDPDWRARRAAVKALAHLGPRRTEPFLKDIALLLDDDEAYVRMAAAETLGTLGASQFAARLGAACGDPEVKVRIAAASALGCLGPRAAPASAGNVAALLVDPNQDARGAAADALGEMGTGAADHAPTLLALLHDERPHLRRAAVAALRKMGALAVPRGCPPPPPPPPGAAMTEERTDELSSQSEGHRHNAAWLPGHWQAALCHADAAVKRGAFDALSRVCLEGSPAPNVPFDAPLGMSPRLRRIRRRDQDKALEASRQAALLQDPNAHVRRTAAEMLGLLGEPAAAAHAAEVSCLLEDQDPCVRCAAAEALGRLGSVARSQHVTAAVALLADQNAAVRSAVSTELIRWGQVAAEPTAQLLDHPDTLVCLAAAALLGALGKDAEKQTVRRLVALLRDYRDWRVRRDAALALGRIHEAEQLKEAIQYQDKIAALLKDPEARVRVAAVEALVSLGPSLHAVALASSLQDEDASVRLAVYAALGRVEGVEASNIASTALTQSLALFSNDSSAAERHAAAASLASLGGGRVVLGSSLDWELRRMGASVMGAGAEPLIDDSDVYVRREAAFGMVGFPKESTPALVALLCDRDPEVRNKAALALGQAASEQRPEEMWDTHAQVAKLMAHEDAHVRSAAAVAIDEVGFGAAVCRDATAQAEFLHKVRVAQYETYVSLQRRMDAKPQSSHAKPPNSVPLPVRSENVGPGRGLEFCTLMKDEDPQHRRLATESLKLLEQGYDPDARLKAYDASTQLCDQSHEVRQQASDTLLGLGPAGAMYEAQRQASLLKDPDWSVRRRAVETLGKLGETNGTRARAHVAEVAVLLQDSNAVVRATAADALGQMGPAAAEHAKDLALCLCKEHEDDVLVRASAVQALAHVGPAGLQSIALVMQTLRDEDPRARHMADITFRKMGGMLCGEKGLAKEILSSEDPRSREAAAVAVGNVAKLHAHRISEEGQGHSSFPEHQGAYIAKQHTLLAAQESCPNSLMVHDSWMYGCQTTPHEHALSGQRHAWHHFIGPLVTVLSDSDTLVRAAAAETLGKLGYADSSEVKPELERLLEDAWPEVRDAAQKALNLKTVQSSRFALQESLSK